MMKRLSLFLACTTAITLLSVGLAPQVKAAPASSPNPPKSISMASWPIGMVAYDRAVAMATIMQKYSGIKIILQPTSGMQWFEEIRVGNLVFGSANALDVANAYRGVEAFQKTGPRLGLRQFSNAGVTPAGVFARADRGIKKLSDLRGKRVYGKSQRSTIVNVFFSNMLNYYGIKENEVTVLPFSSASDAAAGVIEGRADAYITAIAGHLTEARRGTNFIFVPVPKEVVEYVNSKTGGAFTPGNATATLETTYGIPQGTPIWGWSQIQCVSKDLSEETVYALIKALYDHYDELATMGPVAAAMKPEVALLTPNVLPYHPGAIRYYKEKGMWTAEIEALQQRLLAEEKKAKK